jgi:CheY-like chemotaxis protein
VAGQTAQPLAHAALNARTPERPAETVLDDRSDLQPGDTVLLIVEDDPHYARVMMDLARENGFKVLVAMRGAEALALAHEYQPAAVSLDVFLPDMLGWNVLSQLKQNPATRHIPVQIITLDEDRQHGLARGAFSFMTKPTTTEGLETALARIKQFAKPRRKRLLLVEDNPAEQLGVRELLGHDDIDIQTVDNGTDALSLLREGNTDCVVLDLKLPDMSGFEVLERIRDDASMCDVPGRRCSPAGRCRPRRMPGCTRWRARSSSRASRAPSGYSTRRRSSSTGSCRTCRPTSSACWSGCTRPTRTLVGRTVLLVDDDARNIFALSSVLERRGMKVLTATTGSEAISVLESDPQVAIVLMDIMMPGMDGYETMQVIRADPAYRRLPMIALTAKAMKGDREKCLEAGASDYLAKPVNTEQLLSALRMWLHR